MTKKEILEMTGLSEQEFYQQYPTQESWTESYKKGGWIQKATASIKRRGTEGKCTPMSKPGCTGRALALAKTFHKMAAKRKKKEEGGYVDMYEEGGKIPDNVLRSRLESHMSPGEAQDYIDSYAQGGVVDVYQLMGMPTPAMYGMGGTTNIGDLSDVISAKNFPNMGYAMGGEVNGPNLLQVDRGNMPIFAEGGMTEKETMSLKDKYNKWLNAKPTTKYASGGMPPHPEIGMDPSGTVPTKSGDINVEKGESMWNVGNSQFIGTKDKTEAMLKDYNNRDLITLASKFNTIERDKAKNEAKEQQLAAMQEQKAGKAMNRMMAKYGGAIQRMYAKGGMVPMYDLGGGTGGLNMNNPAFGSYNLPSSFSQDLSTPVAGPLWNAYGSPSQFNMDNLFQGTSQQTPTPGGLPLPTPLGKADNLGFNYNMNNYLTTMRQQGIRNNQDVTIPTYARQGVDADGNPVSINPNAPSGYTPSGFESKNFNTGDMSNFDKYAPYVMQGLPIAWNLMQSMKKPTKVPGTLGAMSTALEAPKMSGEAGRRALAREGAAARYAWRQAGAQAGPAALTALTNTRMGRIADFEEGLRNAQGQMDYQAAAQRKAYEQFNAQQAMNRYMLQAQADDVPTRYGSAALGQLGQMGESMLNRQLLKQLEG